MTRTLTVLTNGLMDALMPGLVPGIHVFLHARRKRQTWMVGTSPAMTVEQDDRDML
jgi:hypothetical protein